MTPRGPHSHYRDIALATDVLTASGPALTAILYGELLEQLYRAKRPAGLRTAAWKALSILAEADSMATDGLGKTTAIRVVHARTMTLVENALRENDPKRIQLAIDTIAPIADAWSTVRARS